MPAVTIGDVGVVRISDSQDTKAVLQADSTTQYFLPPRMTTAQKNAITSPAEGAVVFDTDLNRLEEYTGSAWQAAGGGSGSGVGGSTGATDNALLRADGTGGSTAQSSTVTLGDTGAMVNALGADVTGMLVRQNATQTANPLVIQDSSSNVQTAMTPDGGAIFNEEGNDVDFRVETDTNANALFVDGGNNNVGIGTGTPDASAMLDIVSTTKGFGLPAMTTAQRNAIGSPRDGLAVYDTDIDKIYVRANAAWVSVGATVVTANKVYKSGSLYTSTSATMTDVDATNAAITITATGSGKALVIFSFVANKATAGSGYYRITDGTNHSDEVQNEFATVTSNGITLMWNFTTSAGSTTYKLQYRTSDANAVQVRNERAISMTVLEIA